MAKNYEVQYSTTSTNNTDVDGQSTLGSAPADTINEIMQKMAKLRALAITRHVVKAAGTYTPALADYNQFWRCTGAVTLNLTAAATLTDGWCLWVAATAGVVTIDPNGAETIDGATTLVLQTGQMACIICTGTTFFSIFTNGQLTTTDPGAVGVTMEYYHNSPSPAVNDVVYNTIMSGNDAGGAKQQYAQDLLKIVDTTAGSEDATREWYLTIAGANTQLMAFNSGGLRVLLPIDLSAAGAGQIAFPAVQNPSAGANTFDDYEEGTFTPVIKGTGTVGTGTYNVQQGAYTKLGNVVTFSIGLDWSAHTGTANMFVDGLPFTALAGTYIMPCSIQVSSLTFAATLLQAIVGSGTTTIVLSTVATGAALASLALDTSASMNLNGLYRV